MKTQKIKREEAQKRAFQRSQRTATQQLEILKLRPGDHKIEVIQVEINNAKYTVSYDRWGYVCDQMIKSDQCSLGQIIGFFIDMNF